MLKRLRSGVRLCMLEKVKAKDDQNAAIDSVLKYSWLICNRATCDRLIFQRCFLCSEYSIFWYTFVSVDVILLGFQQLFDWMRKCDNVNVASHGTVLKFMGENHNLVKALQVYNDKGDESTGYNAESMHCASWLSC
ncbi:uncharacterized protein LOC126409242 [Nymphaea colorata]|nr:uncharacterized protein LOC126409242 [Nymphaea colorata]